MNNTFVMIKFFNFIKFSLMKEKFFFFIYLLRKENYAQIYEIEIVFLELIKKQTFNKNNIFLISILRS